MKLTFHGAAKTVTGSQHLIEVNSSRILLDYGLFQGRRKEAFELNRQGFCDCSKVDAVVLSHAHIDHSGNIPSLARQGFTGDIYCTAATRDLCAVMLMDSAKIQEKDIEFVNRRRERAGKKLFEPLYVEDDVTRIMQQFVGLGYHRRRQILPGVYLTLVDAGHMMGSAHVILDIDDRDTGTSRRLVFSGDIGRAGIPIIRDPEPIVEGADVLIMESTYGNRSHPPYPESELHLERIVNETFHRGGSLLIPAFAVGRTQQLVYALHKLYEARDIPPVPVYVDSPLATNVTSIFQAHPEVYDHETLAFVANNSHKNPFSFDALHFTRSVTESKELNFLKGPAIIIAASGMMEHGRILHHLRNRIEDHRNTILVTGWQAPYTLGRKIVEGAETVNIFGEERQLRAKVEVITGFSGHADQEELVAWAGAMQKKPSHTFIVHGEEEAAIALRNNLTKKNGFNGIAIPEPHQSFEI